jgi:glycine/D-amino acid oxidase-like deaminating enzyme
VTPAPWFDASYIPRAPLDGAHRCDIAVVGGGLAGTAAAALLARRGENVALVERDVIGGGATAANPGIVGAPSPYPYAIAAHLLGRPTASVLWSLARRHRELLREFGADFVQRGGLERGRDLAESARLLRDDGFPVEPRGDGLFFPDHVELDPVRLARLLAAAAEKQGARVFERTPVALERVDPPLLRAPRGELAAEMALVCADADTPALARFFDGIVFAARTRAWITEPLAERVLPVPVTLSGGRAAARQLDDGRVVGFGTPDALVAGAAVAREWSATLALCCDELPNIGPVPGTVRLHAIAGFHGRGLSLALAAAEISASMMLDGRAPEVATAFSPRRHAI